MVDESDLLALLDDDTAAALTTCNCKETVSYTHLDVYKRQDLGYTPFR